MSHSTADLIESIARGQATESGDPLASALVRVVTAARKIHGGPHYYPTHLSGCIGALSDAHCDCGVADLHFAVLALDAAIELAEAATIEVCAAEGPVVGRDQPGGWRSWTRCKRDAGHEGPHTCRSEVGEFVIAWEGTR